MAATVSASWLALPRVSLPPVSLSPFPRFSTSLRPSIPHSEFRPLSFSLYPPFRIPNPGTLWVFRIQSGPRPEPEAELFEQRPV
jgi:hypothetical protein